MAPRASVVNCAAKVRLPAATSTNAIEYFIKTLNNFFLQPQNMLINNLQRRTAERLAPHSIPESYRRPITILPANRHRNPLNDANSSLASRPRQRAIQAMLQDFRLFIKPNQLTHPLAFPLTCGFGNQPDHLSLAKTNLVPGSQTRHPVVHLRDRRGLEVRDVH